MAYRPAAPFATAMKLLAPTYDKVKGTNKKTFPKPENGVLFYGTFRSFGGTEQVENGLMSVVSTGYIDTWYRPDIRPDCRVYIPETEEVYEIIGDPENISMRNQYLHIRVKKVRGGA